MKTKRANHAINVNGKDVDVARPPREIRDEVIERLARDKVRDHHTPRSNRAAVAGCACRKLRAHFGVRVAVKEQTSKPKFTARFTRLFSHPMPPAIRCRGASVPQRPAVGAVKCRLLYFASSTETLDCGNALGPQECA